MADSSRKELPQADTPNEESMRSKEEELEEESYYENEQATAEEDEEELEESSNCDEEKRTQHEAPDHKLSSTLPLPENPRSFKKVNLKRSRSEMKTPLFNQIWNKDSEVALLEGIIEFRQKRGLDPSMNIKRFGKFIKKRLDLDVTTGQLRNKMRNCRRKFLNTEVSARNGKGRTFTDPKERRVKELSRMLWGSEDGPIREIPVPSAKKKTAENPTMPLSPLRKSGGKGNTDSEKVEIRTGNASQMSFCMDMLSRFSNGCVDDRFLRRGLELISNQKREELEEKCRELNLAELRVLSKRALMIHEVTDQILEAYKKFV